MLSLISAYDSDSEDEKKVVKSESGAKPEVKKVAKKSDAEKELEALEDEEFEEEEKKPVVKLPSASSILKNVDFAPKRGVETVEREVDPEGTQYHTVALPACLKQDEDATTFRRSNYVASVTRWEEVHSSAEEFKPEEFGSAAAKPSAEYGDLKHKKSKLLLPPQVASKKPNIVTEDTSLWGSAKKKQKLAHSS